jgi:hypothetical protein
MSFAAKGVRRSFLLEAGAIVHLKGRVLYHLLQPCSLKHMPVLGHVQDVRLNRAPSCKGPPNFIELSFQYIFSLLVLLTVAAKQLLIRKKLVITSNHSLGHGDRFVFLSRRPCTYSVPWPLAARR